jgi:hypothetical protein
MRLEVCGVHMVTLQSTGYFVLGTSKYKAQRFSDLSVIEFQSKSVGLKLPL